MHMQKNLLNSSVTVMGIMLVMVSCTSSGERGAAFTKPASSIRKVLPTKEGKPEGNFQWLRPLKLRAKQGVANYYTLERREPSKTSKHTSTPVARQKWQRHRLPSLGNQ